MAKDNSKNIPERKWNEMTVREYFAYEFLLVLLDKADSYFPTDEVDNLADQAVSLADALIRRLAEKGGSSNACGGN